MTVDVTATPTAGAHTAILRIDDAKTKGLDFAVMNAVVAGTELPAPSYDWSKAGFAQRNEATRYYLTVPEGTKALQVKMSGLAAGSQTRFLAFHPYGVGIDSTASTACYSNYLDGNGCNPTNRSYLNPTPGVWEILVESRRTSPLQANPWQLDAKLLGVTVDPDPMTLESVPQGVATPVSWDVTNDFGQVTANAQGGSLGSAKSGPESIANHDTQTFTVDVPAGATRLDVKIGNTSDTGADLDLFVTGPGGNKQSADGDSEEAVSYTNPAAGTYEITVDGYSVPTGTTSYDYLDVFYAGALGTIDVDEAPFSLANGESHTVAAEPHHTLLEVLRDQVGLTGTKECCAEGEVDRLGQPELVALVDAGVVADCHLPIGLPGLGTRLRLDALSAVVKLDPDAGTATVQAGIRLHALARRVLRIEPRVVLECMHGKEAARLMNAFLAFLRIDLKLAMRNRAPGSGSAAARSSR